MTSRVLWCARRDVTRPNSPTRRNSSLWRSQRNRQNFLDSHLNARIRVLTRSRDEQRRDLGVTKQKVPDVIADGLRIKMLAHHVVENQCSSTILWSFAGAQIRTHLDYPTTADV